MRIADDDGDDAPLSMPGYCTRWPCYAEPFALVNRDGRMVCPKCGRSYGPADAVTAGNTDA